MEVLRLHLLVTAHGNALAQPQPGSLTAAHRSFGWRQFSVSPRSVSVPFTCASTCKRNLRKGPSGTTRGWSVFYELWCNWPRYPPNGGVFTCFVPPERPEEAVGRREPQSSADRIGAAAVCQRRAVQRV